LQQEIVKIEETQVDQRQALYTDVATIKQDRYVKHMDLNQDSSDQVWNAFLQIARFVSQVVQRYKILTDVQTHQRIRFTRRTTKKGRIEDDDIRCSRKDAQ
jgi:hypothetical protein